MVYIEQPPGDFSKSPLDQENSSRQPNIDITAAGLGEIALAPETIEEWHKKRILYVTGPHASGKSAAVRQSFCNGFDIHDLGPIIRQAHAESKCGQSFGDWISANEQQRGKNFTDDLLVSELCARGVGSSPCGTILIGSRSLRGIEYLNNYFDPSETKIVYFSAPLETLFERYKNRERYQNVTFERFEEVLQDEINMGLLTVKEKADTVLENVGTLYDAQVRLRQFMACWLPRIS